MPRAGGLLAGGLLSACLLSGCAGAASPASGPDASRPAGAASPPGLAATTAPTATVAGAATSGGAQFAPAPTTPAVWASTTTPGEPSGPSGSAGGPPPSAEQAKDVSAARPFTPLEVTLPSGRMVTIRPADVAPDGSLVVPADPGQVGWWTGGARPGDRYGSVVLAGHIDSQAYGIGALAELVHARPGQQITVRAGAQQQPYRIAALQEVPKATLASGTDAFRQDVPGRLVLITCAGAYDPARHSYQDNLIVTANPTG